MYFFLKSDFFLGGLENCLLWILEFEIFYILFDIIFIFYENNIIKDYIFDVKNNRLKI